MAKRPHPGFKAVQAEIARKQGITMEAAGRILAAGARKASPAAKAKNPRLKKVKGVAKGPGALAKAAASAKPLKKGRKK